MVDSTLPPTPRRKGWPHIQTFLQQQSDLAGEQLRTKGNKRMCSEHRIKTAVEAQLAWTALGVELRETHHIPKQVLSDAAAMLVLTPEGVLRLLRQVEPDVDTLVF